jgi:LmbE family N-acetylglucosaminyl deacetylase
MHAFEYQKYRKPIVIAPHPDDLEGFTGGLVYLLEVPVTSVVFAGGNLGVWEERYATMDPDEYIRIRLEEAEESAQILGVSEIIYAGYRDRGVPTDEQAVNRVLDLLRQHEPDLVISFEYYKRGTPYPHPDHIATANNVRHAIARYEKRDALDYYLCATLFPNCFVDVTQAREKKLEALARHTTQADLNSVIFPFFERALSKLWGVFNGVQYAEGYRKVDITKMATKLEEGPPLAPAQSDTPAPA